MNYPTFKLTVDLSIKNKITAAEAAALSMPTVSERVDIESVVKFLEKSYSQIKREIDNCYGYGSRDTTVFFEDCNDHTKEEVIEFLEDDGYKVKTPGSTHITISW
jgi:hypothetical protein